MYTYKRNFKLPPINRKRRRLNIMTKDRTFFIRAVLFVCIAIMLVLNYIFVNNAAASASAKQRIAFQTEGQPEDIYGYNDAFKNSPIDPRLVLSQEIPVIYGVNLEEVSDNEDNDIQFDILTEDIKLEIIRFSNEPKDFYVRNDGPQILIYHSHTEEAYRQITGEEYVEAGKWRTFDERRSIVAVGDALQKELEKYGFNVIHDKTNHEPPSLSTAYSRSLSTMKKYAEKYPSLKIYIDVHRDAGENPNDIVKVNGDDCAKVMCVVGTSDKAKEKANYESNYKLAYAITNELEKIKKGFTRPVRIKPGRSKHYNQQMSDMCLLIEFGHNANSLEQAMNSAKYVAQALSRVVDISSQ